MTDTSQPLSDEEISAVLDGEAGDDLVDRFAADPRARERAKELEAASDLLRGELVDPLPASVVDDLVAGALAAMEDAGGGVDAGTDGTAVAEVISFAAPPRSARRRRGPNPLMVAAAVVALAGIGLALVWSGTRGTTTDGGGSAELAGTADGSRAGDEAGASQDMSHIQPSDGAPIELDGFLGEFPDIASLRSAVNADADTAGSTAGLPETAPDAVTVGRCAEQAHEILGATGIAAEPSAAEFAIVDGTDTIVLTFPPADGPDDERALVVTTGNFDVCRPEHQFVPDR